MKGIPVVETLGGFRRPEYPGEWISHVAFPEPQASRLVDTEDAGLFERVWAAFEDCTLSMSVPEEWEDLCNAVIAALKEQAGV